MSDSVKVPVTLKCPKCGAPPQRDESLGDDAPVTCSSPDCDAQFGTWGQIRTQVREKVKDEAVAMFRDGLKKSLRGSGWRNR